MRIALRTFRVRAKQQIQPCGIELGADLSVVGGRFVHFKVRREDDLYKRDGFPSLVGFVAA